ncbi:inversin-like [Orbicella faveolata]|uniref:inversin-like n=1 Tax=Orbicella faveolata TaxID=48498 RepID=UPI0009E4BD48|nr:inversin-like [Orbicella faveolata]
MDSEGRTALHLAVAHQNEAAVKVLLSLDKCKVSAQDNMNRSPLHWAAVLGNPQLVKMLLEKNADFTAADGNGATALHYVAQSNFSETVAVFLSFDKIKDIPDKDGRTALMWAAGKGSENALKTMLERNLDVHATDKTGGTALHSAAYSGHVNCVKLLIQFGACVDALDMLEHTPIYRACEMGHTEVVNSLILNGATVNLEDQDGRTLLHWAALGGHAPICVALIEQGLAVDSKDSLGRTPLQCAAHGGFVKFMTVLIEHGAEMDHQDKDGITALHWSCASGHLEAVKLLIRNRAFPNFTELDTDRLTPLDYAIIGDHQDVAQYMIEQGALTINGIQDIAATTIQKCWRGYNVRKEFEDRKPLLVRHNRTLHGKKRASAAEQKRSLDLPEIQSPRIVSPSIREESHCSVYDSGISLEASTTDENQDKPCSTSSDERRRAQNDSTADEMFLSGDTAQENATERLVANLLHSSSEEQRSSSVNSSPRQGSENNFQNNSDLMRIISSVLLEENVELEEGLLFHDDKNFRRYSDPKRDLPEKVPANKLHSVTSKSEVARRERERLHLIRTKVNAAVLIQRWYRKWTSIRREHIERDLMFSEVKNEQEELNREVAALTIQLAWRKHVRLKIEKNSTRTKHPKPKKPPQSTPASCRPKQNGIHIYGRSIEKGPPIGYANSRSASKRRPGYMKYEPSPAAMSYNMAIDLYHPMGSRQGNSRAAMVTGSARVRPGSMKRTVSGWSHDVGFLTKMNGQRTGTRNPRT